MDAIEALMTRTTVGQLVEPAPDGAVLQAILQAGLRAPDHGRLRPWKFMVVRGEARKALGEVLAGSLRHRMGGAADAQVQRERQKPLRAPLIVVVAALVSEGSSIPTIEQVLSAGAAAENILVAAHALGYAAAWKTGDAAYDADVKAAFGLRPQDAIVGFLYLGSPAKPAARPAPVDVAAHVQEWRGPAEIPGASRIP